MRRFLRSLSYEVIMVGVPKAPTIGSIWGKLSPKERDEVTELFLNWLIVAGQSVKNQENLMGLANLVSYHAKDLKEVSKNAMKPEFRDIGDQVAKLMGVSE